MRCLKSTLIFLFIYLFISTELFADVEKKFHGASSLLYKVYFNGVWVGHIEWNYLGKDKIGDKQVDVLGVNSDAKILSLLNVETKEKIFLESTSYLPLKVERDVLYFGKNELIKEFYDQDKGEIKIVNSKAPTEEVIIKQNAPIHHILALLYFFPEDVDLEVDQWINFNLPTQNLKVKVMPDRMLSINGSKVKTHFLLGRGARKFSLWMDIKERLPLRLEFITMAGKIIVKRVNPDNE